MNSKLTRQADKALNLAKNSARELRHTYVGTEHLLMGLLKEQEGMAGKLLREFGVDEEKLLETINRLVAPVFPGGDTDEGPFTEEDSRKTSQAPKNPPFSPRALSVIEAACLESESMQGAKAGTEHLLLAMLRETTCLGTRLLHTLGINFQKLYSELLSDMGYDNESIMEEFQSMRSRRGQTATLTPTLDQFSRDLTDLAAEGRMDPIIGRGREIGRLMQILSRRTKNNPCLVGEPGVGKTAIVEGLAERIVEGMVPESMKNKRLVVLDVSGMVAGTKYRGEFEERIKSIVEEVRDNQNIILFVDELHTIIGAGGAEGALDAANILKPSLSRGEIQLIGATTLEEYRKYIERDAALERRFQPVTVEEPTEEEALEILKGIRPYYEEHHKVKILDEALEAAVRMSVRYVNDRFLPDKAIDVIDEASSRVRLSSYTVDKRHEELEMELKDLQEKKESAVSTENLAEARQIQARQNEIRNILENDQLKADRINRKKQREVTENTVADIISEWTRIPVKKLTESETKRLSRLEKELHRRVIGQDEAVRAVAQAVKRGRVGLKDPNRPIGSFLFLGPTGVGKTELAKALAEAVFGSEQAMIRVDMSEYMEKHSVSRMIGSPPGYVGYDEGGQLSEKVRRNPYSVILFDEIEKAHPDVFNILLQVLDDGHITDSHGRKVDFKQTIIIMTSNAGAQAIIEPKRLGFVSAPDEKKDYERMKQGVMDEVKRIFRPEFLNRIDEIMVFHTLQKPDIRKIVDLLLANLIRRSKEQMGIDLQLTPAARDLLCEAGFDVKYGARPLKRAIQVKVEDALANEILDGRVKRGDKVRVGRKEKEIVFTTDEKKQC